MEDRQLYSRVFKMQVVNEVETGKLSKEEARLKYGIRGNSAILNWQRQFTQERQQESMKRTQTTMSKEELENRIKELEKSLSDERFRSRAYQIYVEELEKAVGKPMAKKSVIGQLTGLTKSTDAKE
jgi:transposase-like protein